MRKGGREGECEGEREGGKERESYRHLHSEADEHSPTNSVAHNSHLMIMKPGMEL